MEKRVLLIVAAGKSSRFGGYPKAFCKIGDRTNAENTIYQAEKIFDEVYIGVNRATCAEFNSKITGCEMFSIVSGQGDAHSLLKCLNYIKDKEPELKNIYVCWGDAVFVDSQPLQQFVNKTEAENYKVAVACVEDKSPYAWFEVNEDNRILQSHFASNEGGAVEKGLHDQSLFFFDLNFALKYLNEYREHLCIPYDNDETKSDKNEMKLLFSFVFLQEHGYEPAKCIPITSEKVFSFNTKEELEQIKANMGL